MANYTYFSENRLQYRLSWRRCVVTRRFLGVLLPALAVLFFSCSLLAALTIRVSYHLFRLCIALEGPCVYEGNMAAAVEEGGGVKAREVWREGV